MLTIGTAAAGGLPSGHAGAAGAVSRPRAAATAADHAPCCTAVPCCTADERELQLTEYFLSCRRTGQVMSSAAVKWMLFADSYGAHHPHSLALADTYYR